ncbi:MAG TPA: DUF1972 domain-containing protein [Burkholderiales bacterium]|jgi:glycosyltransferase involved in cell wall biosynthesis|nr:DUF1972 domain-containing protein [Burkholderiales bacterium]
MKKIAILGIRGIPAQYGGFETFAEEISIRLAESGVDVTVYCESNSEKQYAPAIYKGVKLVYLSSPSLGSLSTIVFDLKCFWHARKNYDVVYMLGYGASMFAFIPRLFGSKVWINMDGLEWVRSKWSGLAKTWLKFGEKMSMWTPNRIIADAQAIQDNLNSRYKKMPNCSVIPYGAYIVKDADKNLLIDFELRPQEYFLIVCRLEPENYILEIIQGFLQSDTSFPLVVVGNHSTGTDYVSHLLKFKDKRIRFVGTVYEQPKLQALRSFTLGYFHGHSVGGTNPSLLEALGCGSPVIAHNNPFNHEVIQNAGMFFSEPVDIPDLISKLENDVSLREQMITLGHKIIQERYTWEKITDSYLKLLD